jgi:hypothetical protein
LWLEQNMSDQVQQEMKPEKLLGVGGWELILWNLKSPYQDFGFFSEWGRGY